MITCSHFLNFASETKCFAEIAPHLLHTSAKIHKGKRLHSTIDSNLQEQVNLIVENHKRNLSASEIHNIAVLVVEVETGNVKAYVGNTKDENYSYSNQVDIIQSKRVQAVF